MKNRKKIYVTRPYLPPRKILQSYIDKVYENGILTTNGPLVRELERKLQDYLGVRNVVAVSSGTSALEVAYKAINFKHEIITTPFSFVATTSSLVWSNLDPKFVDINYNNLTIDSSKIISEINKNTTGLVPVHVYGFPCEVENIEAIAREYNLKTVYDAAHCFGVKFKNKSILNFGDLSVLSFHATKLFHTIEGGAIISNSDSLAGKIRTMINFGLEEEHNVLDVGTNTKMNEFEALMGLSVLQNIKSIIQDRKHNWNYYHDELIDLVEFPEPPEHTEWNYSYVPVVFRSSKELLQVKDKLNRNEIYPRRYFYPSLNTLRYIHSKTNCSIAQDLSQRILCLPTYYKIGDENLSGISKIIKNSIKDVR